MIAHHYTESNFAFAYVTADEGWHNAPERDPVVLVYDLDSDGPWLPGEPEVHGKYLGTFYASTLAEWEQVLEFSHCVVPLDEMRGVHEFLHECLASLART